MSKRILFICGSLNQTRMMHKISLFFPDDSCFFTPYYADGFINMLTKMHVLDFTVLGGQFRASTLAYLTRNNLTIVEGNHHSDYDLIYTCSDLIIPANIKNKNVILVQEGMTDPENIIYHIVKKLKLPLYLASTSTTGLSDAYKKFCVASEGYKKLFTTKGVNPEKIIVTGIPNFDDCRKYLINNFEHKNFVLAATSDSRETYKYENRKKFIRNALEIANGRKLIFKLHPNENFQRATAEINKYAPWALVYSSGKVEEMIANCDELITKYSSVVFVGIALEKEVYSDFNIELLKELTPIQNGGKSAQYIAEVGKEMLSTDTLIMNNNNIKKFFLPIRKRNAVIHHN